MHQRSAGLPAPAGDPVSRQTDSTSAGLGYTRTLSPTLINEFRFTWTSITMAQNATVARNEIIPGSLDARVDSGTPIFNISNYASYGSQASCCGNGPLKKSSGVWDWSDNVSKSFGAHTLKVRRRVYAHPSFHIFREQRAQDLGFTGVFTQSAQRRSDTGSSVADLLLGDANSLTTGTVAEAVERAWFGSGYAQDQWTLNQHLTLSLGIRYEYASPYIETQNRMADFILDPGSPFYGRLISKRRTFSSGVSVFKSACRGTCWRRSTM